MMLVALWLGSLVIWSAVGWDRSVLRQWQAGQIAQRVEQQAELALAMMNASLEHVTSHQIEQRTGLLECIPNGCRKGASQLWIRPGGQGVVLLIKDEKGRDVGYTIRHQRDVPTLWMQVAGKGAAVAVVSGITSLQWIPDTTGSTGRLQVTARSGGDRPVVRTLTQVVALGRDV